ncbi:MULTISPECIES: fumarylacetoacetate hydrolase family protein [Rhizobium/Agrobacterium group]|uniref:fumarylacetoacetate hydrolase family protein n=1 Tax=Rhizobium/Agrobacterium group TaxID=227290 RepID=UPI001ADCD4FD|nr:MULTISPECIES: fumarylacetoacetate hydrolase family protein [Rhizobium/Agrobacterium group]MBO9112581.1 fumarylacetoacetate hydrolase family protein [Agrobacterium sp. S2/73]QXZ76083.1 fumarylacetoacetate hydrolase family protein [Agrobacterium sp. S7/73]QYA16911.1 fumarylacetoacetate hydrolase family protein [Rhizobium sp. AB2/73]UEQ85517.1 fumarylacetoacetate hydrolase family protein [Rhizobium sp. AB2/73]
MRDYKLATGLIDGQPTPLVLVDGRVWLLSEVLGDGAPSDLLDVFRDWQRLDGELAGAVSGLPQGARDPSSITFSTPLGNPPKLICIGTNYKDHLAEMKVTTLPDFPYAFLRPNTSLAAHGETIKLPSLPRMVDWEAELGFVIGKRAEQGSSPDPMELVAGYTVINDISARDWIATRPHVGIDWVMQKAWDKFQPTGPWITPARFVANPQDLPIELMVNGIVKQQSNTCNMIFGVADVVRHLLSIMTLEPGDLIATGTPAGVGFGKRPPEFITAGDVVTVSVQGLGRLENNFV